MLWMVERKNAVDGWEIRAEQLRLVVYPSLSHFFTRFYTSQVVNIRAQSNVPLEMKDLDFKGKSGVLLFMTWTASKAKTHATFSVE